MIESESSEERFNRLFLSFSLFIMKGFLFRKEREKGNERKSVFLKNT